MRLKHFVHALLLSAIALVLSGCGGFSIEPQLHVIKADDGYPLNTYELILKTGFFSTKPAYKGTFFHVQGSNYQTALTEIPRLAAASALGFKVILLERRGIDQKQQVDLSEAYRFSDKNTRVQDHLRVISEYLRNADSDKPVILMGGSEGADVAAVVAEQENRITHLILLAGGGGWTQAEEIEFLIKKNGSYLGLNSVGELQQKLADIQTHPSDLTLWAGHPYRRWSSYLFDHNVDYLVSLHIPLILVQGDQDESVPIESARAAKAKFDQMGKGNISYREIQGANHSFVDVKSGKSFHPYVEIAVIKWLQQTGVLNDVEADEFIDRVKKAHPDLFP